MKMLDLFSGIGGFSIAGMWSGFKTVQFVEKDIFCQKVLKKHWPHVPIHDDIKTFNFTEKVNLMTGGFPCQPFSISGKQKGRQDVRYLWNDFYRIIRMSKPSWVIAENVPGFIKMELDNIITDLEKENYETTTFVLPACAANAPHRRDRVWVIANYLGERCNNSTNYREERLFQKDFLRNLEEIHQRWEKLKPESWQTMQARGWLALNSHASRIDNGLPNRMDRIRSIGNAVVPQLVYPITKFIFEVENGCNRYY